MVYNHEKDSMEFRSDSNKNCILMYKKVVYRSDRYLKSRWNKKTRILSQIKKEEQYKSGLHFHDFILTLAAIIDTRK